MGNRWFRHYAGMMRDDKLVRAAMLSKQPVERVVWIWGAILESAAEVNDDGRYDIDEAEVAYFLRADQGDVRAVLDALATNSRLAEGRVVKWGERQFQSDRSAARQDAYRQRRRSAGGDGDDQKTHGDWQIDDGDTAQNVTSQSLDGIGDDIVTDVARHGDAPETETETETETEKKVSHPSGAHPPQVEIVVDIVPQAIAIFNASAERVGWAKVQRTTGPRRTAVVARVAELGGLDGWTAAVEKAASIGFLCGENERGWKLDFDFLIKPKNLTKIMEGGYDRSARTPTGNGKQSPHTAFLGALAREAEKRSGGGEREPGSDDGSGDFAGLPPPASGGADDLEIPTFLRRQ